MIRYPDDYSPIREYWEQIRSGKVNVSKKVRRTYQKIIFDLDNQVEFFYNPRRANHIIEFAENFCRHSKGKLGGQRVVLELWEKAMLATIFGFVDIDGCRKYRKALLVVGKKNGKSLIASIVGLYLFVADGEAGPEVYAVATKRDQSKIIWMESKRMVNKSPVLKKKIKPLVGELTCDFNDGVFKPLASDSDTLDGLNIHGVLMDEMHQWRNGKALYDIMADGVTAREQPLILETTTAGTVREDIYDAEYDDAAANINSYDDDNIVTDERSIAFIYELDTRDEWENEDAWYKANPGLGTIKNLVILRDRVEKAKRNPLLVKNVLCKDFNIRETTGESWLTFEEANSETLFDIKELKPRYGIGGCDMSKTTDLTAAKVIFMVPGDEHIYVRSMYWIPEELLEKRVAEDKIPYDVWHERGLLRLCRGNVIDQRDVTAWFLEVQNEEDIYLFGCGYDSWSAQYWVAEMKETFGETVMEPVIQGKKTLSQPMHQLKADLEAKRIVYNNNPIDKWCLCNASVDVDKNGNIQLCKPYSTRRRVDGTAALIDAYVVLQRRREEYLSMI